MYFDLEFFVFFDFFDFSLWLLRLLFDLTFLSKFIMYSGK